MSGETVDPAQRDQPKAAALHAWTAHLGEQVEAQELSNRLSSSSLPALLRESALRRPGHLALDIGGERVTHGELAERVACAAGWFSAHGIGPGRRVLLCGSTSLAYVIAYLGVLAAGGTVVLASSALTVVELEQIVTDSGAAAAVGGGGALEKVRELAAQRGDLRVMRYDGDGGEPVMAQGASGPLPPAPDPRQPALIAFTSGTTGRPKGVPLSHANVVASILGAMWSWRWSAADVLVHALPLSHQHGLSGIHATIAAGSSAILRPTFEAEDLLATLVKARGTVLFSVPAIYARLVEAALPPLPALRLAVSGSAPLSPELAERIAAWLGELPLERYGTTESGLDLSNLYEGPRRAGRVGVPLPGVEVDLRDDAGETVDAGAEGEICVRGPQVFAGYLDDPEATEQAFWPRGWFRTGDIGSIDPHDGSVAIVGRSKELIITGGLNVYPREVELVLERHPAVGEAAVVGVPDDRWGERVTAFVVAVDDRVSVAADVLEAHARAHLAPYKCPKQFVVVPSMPRNAMGKIQRDVLGRQAATVR